MFTELDESSTVFCRAEVESLSHSVAPIEFRCLKDWKDFDYLATEIVRGEDGNGKGVGSKSDGSGTWIGQGVTTGVIIVATGIVDRGGF